MAPNGKCVRHTEAETSRINRQELLQGEVLGIHQLFQLHTHGNHSAPQLLSCYHIIYVHREERAENEIRMVAPRPNSGPI